MSRSCILPFAVILIAVFPFGVPAQSTVDDASVLAFLERTIAWHREISSIEDSAASSREALSADALRQNSMQAVRYAFEFARGADAIPNPESDHNEKPDSSRSRNLMQLEAAAEKRMEDLQRQIGELDRRIQSAPERSRATLSSRRDVLTGEFNLTKARREALRGVLGFLNAAPGDGLSAKIKDLERSVPGLQATAKQSEPAPARVASSQDFHPETSGIAGLVADVFAFTRRMSQLRALAEKTDALRQENDKLRTPLRKAFREVIQRGDEIAKADETASPEELKAYKKELDGLVLRFNQLTAATGPLGRQVVPLDASYSSLVQWRNVVREENSTALRYLLLRLGMLGLAILVIFIFSEMWRRATMRYVRDIRRRRQFLLLRRIVVGCTIALFVVLSFVTEFGSLATFAGFSAAGIAVALQSVILSVVAYFFLVGRWGVKVGDRVTVSGVTGEVIEIGLFRMYLMELSDTAMDLHPTGRIVVFPNAVFFQPSALFKQFPGIDYTWHAVSVTLTRDCDHGLVQKQLMTAVESVYGDSREAIERQHEAARASMNLHTDVPRPESRVRLIDSGLEILIRYPVEIPHAAATDDRITKELMELVEKDPNLKLCVAGSPKIQTLV